MTVATALVVVSAVYWGIVALLPQVAVSPVAWVTLFVVCFCCSLLLATRRPRAIGASSWLYYAVCAVILAVLFLGADIGLDLLKGPHRPKANVAASIGGLEFWFVLCPGVVSVALAGAVASLVARYRPRAGSLPAAEGRRQVP